MTDNEKRNEDVGRPERFISHALVEVRKYKLFPFFIQSGILLDMSTAGFKAEYTGNNVNVKIGDILWMRIPVMPLGLRGMKDLDCKVEIKWFDPKTARIGGVFLELEPMSQMTIQQIVSKLKDNGNKI
ncbi:MAG: hypothetical protein NT027_08145 [Proteobacteria bacterium]|nr:hypothetical protein [Pseudomonadota bacterium]